MKRGFASLVRVPRGHELTISTEASDSEGVVWQAKTVALSMDRSPRDRVQPLPAQAADDIALLTGRWSIKEDTGRRFAPIAGDRNPIHLWALTARPFGFSRAIVHGMFTLGRALGALESRGFVPGHRRDRVVHSPGVPALGGDVRSPAP